MWFPHSKFPNLLLSTTTIETLTSTLTQVDAWDAPKVLWQTAVSTSTDLLISLMPVGWNGTLDIGYFSSYYAEIAPTIVPRSFIIQPAFSQMSTRVSWNGSITDYNGSDLYGGPVTPATCNVAMSNTGTTVRGPILSGFSFFTIRSQKLSRTNDQDGEFFFSHAEKWGMCADGTRVRPCGFWMRFYTHRSTNTKVGFLYIGWDKLYQ